MYFRLTYYNQLTGRYTMSVAKEIKEGFLTVNYFTFSWSQQFWGEDFINEEGKHVAGSMKEFATALLLIGPDKQRPLYEAMAPDSIIDFRFSSTGITRATNNPE